MSLLGILARYGEANKTFSNKISVFLFGKYTFTHSKLSLEGIINHIMLQYFFLICFLSKTLENHKFFYVFKGL